jgi:DNA-binding response OmpR family regulator
LLQSEGYQVVAVGDGEEALRRWRAERVDLLVLDIMMPGRNGYDVCREVRRRDDRVPILMLTAKGDETDKVVGLELGADDYLTKPFGVHEVLARLGALLRRCHRQDRPADDDLPETFAFGAAEISRVTFRGRLGERSFDLTPRELSLLEFFASRPGAVLSRERLMQTVWETEYYGNSRAVDQHIAQLRKKIEPDPANPSVITTVHGAGYRYEGE